MKQRKTKRKNVERRKMERITFREEKEDTSKKEQALLKRRNC
jgi:hypothetical protein